MSDKREWSAEASDGTQYTLTIDRGRVTVSYMEPPEYHYRLSDNCSIDEFVGGQLQANVEQLFGADKLRQALDYARAQSG